MSDTHVYALIYEDPTTDGDGNNIEWVLAYNEIDDNDETGYQVLTLSRKEPQIRVVEYDDYADVLERHSLRTYKKFGGMVLSTGSNKNSSVKSESNTVKVKGEV